MISAKDESRARPLRSGAAFSSVAIEARALPPRLAAAVFQAKRRQSCLTGSRESSGGGPL
jgi:hypothetical protein